MYGNAPDPESYQEASGDLPYQLKWTKAVIQDLVFDVPPCVWLPASRMSGNQIVYSDMEIIQTLRAGVHVLKTHMWNARVFKQDELYAQFIFLREGPSVMRNGHQPSDKDKGRRTRMLMNRGFNIPEEFILDGAMVKTSTADMIAMARMRYREGRGQCVVSTDMM